MCRALLLTPESAVMEPLARSAGSHQIHDAGSEELHRLVAMLLLLAGGQLNDEELNMLYEIGEQDTRAATSVAANSASAAKAAQSSSASFPDRHTAQPRAVATRNA